MVRRLIVEEGGHVFVAGNAKQMPDQVRSFFFLFGGVPGARPRHCVHVRFVLAPKVRAALNAALRVDEDDDGVDRCAELEKRGRLQFETWS